MATLTHRPDQIVVALSQLELVLDALGRPEFGLSATVLAQGIRESPELGLALINLPGFTGSVDGLLADLRQHFRGRFDNYELTLGKNRIVGNVGARHVIGGGGAGAPRPVPAGTATRLAAGRSTGTGTGTGGLGARVTVADTAIFPHPAMAGAYLADPESLLPAPGPGHLPYPAGHATFVTSLVLRHAPLATVRVQVVLDDEAVTDSWDLAVRVVAAARSGTDVVNLSLGCFTDDDEPPLVLSAMLGRLGPGVVVVAAAGNHGADARPGRPLWPAAFDSVVAVGAAYPDGKPAPFSPDAPWVDLLAPGVDVVGAYLGDGIEVRVPRADGDGDELVRFDGAASWNGSSFAAGLVCGLIAERVVPGQVDAPSAYRNLRRDVAAGRVGAWLPSRSSDV
jgi:hypothetical protein